MKNLNMIAVLLATLLVNACSSVPYSEGYPKSEAWALLPVVNHSEEANASELTLQALQQVLVDSGLEVDLAPVVDAEGSNNLLSSASLLAQAKQWSHGQQIPLALSAVVEQWQVDEAGRGQLELSLQLLDGITGSSLWMSEAAATGQPGQTPEDLLPGLLAQLVAALPLVE